MSRSRAETLHVLTMIIIEIALGDIAPEEVHEGAKLIEDLNLDSLDYATVLLSCEEQLGIRVPEASINWSQVQTVGQLADVLQASSDSP